MNDDVDDENGFRKPNSHLALRDARLAQYILANTGRHVPSLDALRRSRPAPAETVDGITEKIEALKKRHAKDLARLFAFQRAEYEHALVDHRTCHDVSAYMDIDGEYADQVAFRDALARLDRDVLCMDRFKRDADDALSCLRYEYLGSLQRLVKRRNALRTQDRAARQKRDAWFPQTPQQYYQIPERDIQLRIARFLTGTTVEQEKMSDEFGWPFRAVNPLLTAYKTDLTFKHDVDVAMAGLMVSDPRRRKSDSFARFEPVS